MSDGIGVSVLFVKKGKSGRHRLVAHLVETPSHLAPVYEFSVGFTHIPCARTWNWYIQHVELSVAQRPLFPDSRKIRTELAAREGKRFTSPVMV
jgi:hypothetical protein